MSTRNDKRMNWNITTPANRRKWIRTEWTEWIKWIYLIYLLLVFKLLLLLQLVLSVISILDLLFLLLVWAASFCRTNLQFESFASALQVHAYGSVFTLVRTHCQKSISIWECWIIALVSVSSSIKYLIAVMQNWTCKSSQHGKKQGSIVELKIGNKTYCFHPDQQDPVLLAACLFSLFFPLHWVWFWAWDIPNQLYLCSVLAHYLQEGKIVRNCVFPVIYRSKMKLNQSIYNYLLPVAVWLSWGWSPLEASELSLQGVCLCLYGSSSLKVN